MMLPICVRSHDAASRMTIEGVLHSGSQRGAFPAIFRMPQHRCVAFREQVSIFRTAAVVDHDGRFEIPRGRIDQLRQLRSGTIRWNQENGGQSGTSIAPARGTARDPRY